MNIATIRATLNAELDLQAAALGEDATLTDNENVDVTNALAAKLETVNPTTNYPPTGR